VDTLWQAFLNYNYYLKKEGLNGEKERHMQKKRQTRKKRERQSEKKDRSMQRWINQKERKPHWQARQRRQTVMDGMGFHSLRSSFINKSSVSTMVLFLFFPNFRSSDC